MDIMIVIIIGFVEAYKSIIRIDDIIIARVVHIQIAPRPWLAYSIIYVLLLDPIVRPTRFHLTVEVGHIRDGANDWCFTEVARRAV